MAHPSLVDVCVLVVVAIIVFPLILGLVHTEMCLLIFQSIPTGPKHSCNHKSKKITRKGKQSQ